MEDIMRKRQQEKDAAYEAQWDNGKGSHHPDYDPLAFGEGVSKASRQTEELYNAIVKNDIKLVYQKISAGAATFAPDGPVLHHATALLPKKHRVLGAVQAMTRCCTTAGADVNFVFGEAYQCIGGYTPLMVASHRGRLECAKALLRAGADPNYTNEAHDLTIFWAIDGGVEMIKLLHEYGMSCSPCGPVHRLLCSTTCIGLCKCRR